MVIAEVTNVRTLCGNRGEAIISTAKITEAIDFSDAFVKTKTQKQSWVAGTDVDYESLKKASEYIAASDILSGFADEEEDAKKLWDKAITILDAINANLITIANAQGAGTEAEGGTVLVSQPYTTRPLNPAAAYYSATEGYLVSEEGVESLEPQ